MFLLQQLKKWLEIATQKIKVIPEQRGQFMSGKKELMNVYREKWEQIALSTEPIDRQKTFEIVEKAYSCLGIKTPKVIFCDSPASIRDTFFASGLKSLGFKLNGKLERSLLYKMKNNQAASEFAPRRSAKIQWQYVLQKIPPFPFNVNFAASIFDAAFCDFCITVLYYSHSQKEWETFQQINSECGWVYFFENACIVCDRPRILKFDAENRLHAEGEPAIQFADGYSLYSYHGVTLPEQYGKVHPHQWQSEWLLTEDNVELRRVLIQGIGYDRICQELEASELDTWQEYTLLKIDADIDAYEPPDWDRDAPPREPIYLLKMTCPSTGHIHALRVPPAMTTARDAIKWVNWDIDPGAFAIQT